MKWLNDCIKALAFSRSEVEVDKKNPTGYQSVGRSSLYTSISLTPPRLCSPKKHKAEGRREEVFLSCVTRASDFVGGSYQIRLNAHCRDVPVERLSTGFRFTGSQVLWLINWIRYQASEKRKTPLAQDSGEPVLSCCSGLIYLLRQCAYAMRSRSLNFQYLNQ